MKKFIFYEVLLRDPAQISFKIRKRLSEIWKQ